MANNFIAEEDLEDFEQEKLIKEWLKKNDSKNESQFYFKYISRKGTARNSRVRASISLDQKIQEDSAGTFADLIAGSDGRDLYCGEEPNAEETLDAYLSCLGLNEELTEWVLKTLKLWVSQNSSHFEKYLTDSQWEKPW